MIRLIALACGVLCGAGLTVGGLTDPARTPGYLGLAGPWDPTLAVVLLVAIAVAMAGFGVASVRGIVVADPAHRMTRGRGALLRLLAGSLLFGLGWGLAGFFPAAALVATGLFAPDAMLFLAAVLGGMGLHDLLTVRRGGASGPRGWSRG